MGIPTRTGSVLAALIAWCCLSSSTALASSLEISPVSVNLVAGQNAKVIEVRNRGGSSVAIQIRAYAWSQSGDTDILGPTKDIILSPPIFTIPAGAAQTIRLLLRGKSGTGERSYVRHAKIENTVRCLGVEHALTMSASLCLSCDPSAAYRFVVARTSDHPC